MPKRKVYSGKDIIKILEIYGFIEIRQKGSHIVMQKSTKNSKITIPVPDHKELKAGTLNSIIRQSGLDKRILK